MSTTFEDYVVARGERLRQFGYVLTGDLHLSQDLVQEALAKAHRRWTRISSLDHPDAYVRRMIVNSFLSWRQRAARVTVLADPPEPPASGAGDHSAQHAERDAMWQVLATLPRQQRAVLVLRFYEGLPDDEIARLVHCSAGTVRVHASRGLARLREDAVTLAILKGDN